MSHVQLHPTAAVVSQIFWSECVTRDSTGYASLVGQHGSFFPTAGTEWRLIACFNLTHTLIASADDTGQQQQVHQQHAAAAGQCGEVRGCN